MTSREERLAINEAAFRSANERMNEWDERHEGGRTERYYCECAAATCHEQLTVSSEDYEAVRAEASHFLVLPGHEVPDVETVIRRTEDFFVVEKPPSVDHIVEPSDPRGS